ncbi:MAG: hypothetical protein AAB436_03300 [Patescibacteria group bacterium]
MFQPYELGQEAFGEPLIPSEFKRTNLAALSAQEDHLWTLGSNPDLIIRSGDYASPESGKDASLHLGDYTEALFHLSDAYAIHPPAISFAHETDDKGKDTWFVAANRVEGASFQQGISDEHQAVAQEAYDSILEYYRSMIKRDGLYIADLSLRQLVYGKTAGNTQPAIYMVDVDPQDLFEINSENRQEELAFIALYLHQFGSLEKDVLKLNSNDRESNEKKIQKLLVDLYIARESM